MLKVVLTSFFFIIILAELALDTILPLPQLVYCTYILFGTRNCTTLMVEWLSRWISDQTVVGSTPIRDDLFCARYFFFNYNFHEFFFPS